MSKLVKRPWGTYTILAKSKDFLLKKITVLPEGVLSYQSHNYRSEHWIILQGKANIEINDDPKPRATNGSISSLPVLSNP